MARPMNSSEQKLAEKLSILKDRRIGMLSCFDSIKNVCGNAKSKTTFSSDKTLESSIKEDCKTVIALFNAAQKMVYSQPDPSFPRLVQMIMDYDVSLKKHSEQFTMVEIRLTCGGLTTN